MSVAVEVIKDCSRDVYPQKRSDTNEILVVLLTQQVVPLMVHPTDTIQTVREKLRRIDYLPPLPPLSEPPVPSGSVGLEFVVAKGSHGCKAFGTSLFLDTSLKTCVYDCAHWVAYQLGKDEDTEHKATKRCVTLYLGDHGAIEIDLDKRYSSNYLKMKETAIGDLLCYHRPIVVNYFKTSTMDGKPEEPAGIPPLGKNAYYPLVLRNTQAPLPNHQKLIDLDVQDGLTLCFQEQVSFQIFVKTTTGTCTLNVSPCHTIRDVKEKLKAMGKADSVHDQTLTFHGRALASDETIMSCNLRPEATLHLSLLLRGGTSSHTFVDVTRSHALVEGASDPRAPRWRVYDAGLNLLGICTNRDCIAVGDEVVCQMGFVNFDLMNGDRESVCCPMCNHQVVPKLPLFNRCRWRLDAVKSASETHVFCTSWKLETQRGRYATYDDVRAGSAIFSRLQIYVRSLEIPTVCSICLETLERDQTVEEHVTGCGHYFHRGCWTEWRDLGYSFCPNCRARAS